eukprot:537114-Amphidinium_carterae.1
MVQHILDSQTSTRRRAMPAIAAMATLDGSGRGRSASPAGTRALAVKPTHVMKPRYSQNPPTPQRVKIGQK